MLLERLSSVGELSPAAALRGLRERSRPGRPYLVLNMVSSVDGRAAPGGTSRGLAGSADRALFHALRAEADALLVGAGTARVERYGRVVRDPETRAARAERGLSPDALLCVVSGRLRLPADLPLLNEPEQPLVVITSVDHELERVAAPVHYLRARPLVLRPLLERLHAEHGVGLLLCEGGPTLNAALIEEGLVDELFLTLAARLSAGPSAPAIVAEAASGAGVGLILASVLEHGSDLLLRYEVPSAGAGGLAGRSVPPPDQLSSGP